MITLPLLHRHSIITLRVDLKSPEMSGEASKGTNFYEGSPTDFGRKIPNVLGMEKCNRVPCTHPIVDGYTVKRPDTQVKRFCSANCLGLQAFAWAAEDAAGQQPLQQ